MQDLTLVGLTEDKKKLVLVSDSGEEYALPADAKLRAALRGDHARLGQLEIQMESALRPRDIQARIRAGESPESVAAAAQTSVDKIMGYATPVLAERAHIADRAQRSSVRRKAGEGPARLLGDAVEERLRSRNIAPGSVEWDAWRRDDGRWTLVADYRSGDSAHHAEFLYDVPGRYVIAHDDEAKWLVGEQTARRGPQPRTSSSARRLSAVSPEDELPLGEDAIGMLRGDQSEGEVGESANGQPVDDRDGSTHPEEPTVDLSDAAASVRRTGAAREIGLPIDTGDADWISTQASERPAGSADASSDQPATASPRADAHDEPLPPGDGTEDGIGDSSEDGIEEGNDDPAEEPTEPKGPPRRATKKSRGRASVPSWDEIMFGGGRSE